MVGFFDDRKVIILREWLRPCVCEWNRDLETCHGGGSVAGCNDGDVDSDNSLSLLCISLSQFLAAI